MSTLSTRSLQSFSVALTILEEAGIKVIRQSNVVVRGPRQGMGYGPCGSQTWYEATTSAPLNQVIAAIPPDRCLDLSVESEGKSAHLDSTTGKWHLHQG